MWAWCSPRVAPLESCRDLGQPHGVIATHEFLGDWREETKGESSGGESVGG